MNKGLNSITILVADDDPDDRMMIEEAFSESGIPNPLNFVIDGQDLIDYLKRRGKHSDKTHIPLPGLILLDLNMPKKDGREALKEIKSDPSLCRIPVIVLTTSKVEEDIYQTYNLGVNSFISKPITFDSLKEVIKILTRYWFEVVILPYDLKGNFNNKIK